MVCSPQITAPGLGPVSGPAGSPCRHRTVSQGDHRDEGGSHSVSAVYRVQGRRFPHIAVNRAGSKPGDRCQHPHPRVKGSEA